MIQILEVSSVNFLLLRRDRCDGTGTFSFARLDMALIPVCFCKSPSLPPSHAMEATARRSAEAQGASAGAGAAAAMENPSAEGLPRAGGATEAGATGGTASARAERPWRRRGRDGDGQGNSDRAIFPASRLKKQFCTPQPQAIASNMQVENSQLEAETDSTASSPQPPLPRGRGHSSQPDGPSRKKPVKIKRRSRETI